MPVVNVVPASRAPTGTTAVTSFPARPMTIRTIAPSANRNGIPWRLAPPVSVPIQLKMISPTGTIAASAISIAK